MELFRLLALMVCFIAIQARTIPPNVQAFYDRVKAKPCANPIKSGFRDGHGNPGFTYCRDRSLIYLSGPSLSLPLADMDIDCDGLNSFQGQCSNDPSSQSQTAFKDTLQKTSSGIPDLNANIHSYVVFGNEGGNPSFDPQSVGMKPLSVMLIICNNQLFYGVWGDTNGGVSTGEASIALATACFPNAGITADNGHTGHDVLYVGFMGRDSVQAAGSNGVRWQAKGFGGFEASLARIGDGLIKKV